MLRLRRNDVVLPHNDVLHLRCKVMWCLPTSPQGETLLTQWTSLPKATSLARKGKHRSKTKSTSYEVLFVLEACWQKRCHCFLSFYFRMVTNLTILCSKIENRPYPQPNPVIILRKFVDWIMFFNWRNPSRHMPSISAIDMNIFPKVNMLIIGPSKQKPITTPVHLAHNGNCTPLIMIDLSLNWWQRNTFLKNFIARCQRKNCLSVIYITLKLVITGHTFSNSFAFFLVLYSA